MEALLLSTVVIFVAELGDKSQLLALAFASRYRFRDVLVGITAATALVHLGSVALGAGLGATFPTRPVTVAAGVAFLGFAVWTWRGDTLGGQPASGARSAVLVVAVAFLLAELGDKTMLATVTLATREGWFGTWVGSTVGMVAADALAIAVGAGLGKRLPEKAIRYGAALAFAAFGVVLLVGQT